VIHRISPASDDASRPGTTGICVGRALAEFDDVVHFRRRQRDGIPAAGFDLDLGVVDTGHRLPAMRRPLACWAIDTHRDLDARLGRASRAGLVLAGCWRRRDWWSGGGGWGSSGGGARVTFGR
jgi:hypothetical protein